ncbi:MAG TPA: class I SAM-dependent methyltransferase [Chthoniobacterales bacterium]|jgi:ubiquinone/menaquinone biosynthesis C-methylase UbiE|nr:class I SAM-dependent methyltransferase [Chthoniobacterales bacterium]
MSAADKVIGQCRKPSGLFGRFILWDMNRHHSKLTDWGLSHVGIEKTDTILDVGCGGGRTISKLAAMASDGKVHGIDYSEESVTAAHRRNTRWIDIGRVSIREGTVSQLPFTDYTFDLITAIETHLFWPDLPNDFREIYRVLKQDGELLIVAEIYKGGKHLEGVRKTIFEKHLAANMNLLTPDEHRELFANAGFSDVQLFEELDKGWICVTGRKRS